MRLDAGVQVTIPQCYDLFKGGEPLDSSFPHKLTKQLKPEARKRDRGQAEGYLWIVRWQRMAALSHLMGRVQAGKAGAPSFFLFF